MIEKERELVKNFIANSLSKEQFLNSFTVDILNNHGYIINLLEEAYKEKDANDVDYLLYLIFTFDLVTEEYIDLLIKLMYAPWHYKHEDIATIFQSFKFPQTVECLYKTAITEFEYLDYDESYALAVKCIWALGAIKTDDSRKKLEVLSQSENEIIRDNAIKQLERN